MLDPQNPKETLEPMVRRAMATSDRAASEKDHWLKVGKKTEDRSLGLRVWLRKLPRE